MFLARKCACNVKTKNAARHHKNQTWSFFRQLAAQPPNCPWQHNFLPRHTRSPLDMICLLFLFFFLEIQHFSWMMSVVSGGTRHSDKRWSMIGSRPPGSAQPSLRTYIRITIQGKVKGTTRSKQRREVSVSLTKQVHRRQNLTA